MQRNNKEKARASIFTTLTSVVFLLQCEKKQQIVFLSILLVVVAMENRIVNESENVPFLVFSCLPSSCFASFSSILTTI